MGECGHEALMWFLWVGLGKAGLGLASLKNCGGLGCRGCPKLSGTWPWGDRAGDSGPKYESSIEVGGTPRGLPSYGRRASGELSGVLRKEPDLGAAGPPGQ